MLTGQQRKKAGDLKSKVLTGLPLMNNITGVFSQLNKLLFNGDNQEEKLGANRMRANGKD